MITKTKIDWADFTWNPVWGCLNKCPYCYARKIAGRFAERIAEKEMNWKWIKNWKGTISKHHEYYLLVKNIKNFQPIWLESNYQKSFPGKPSRIFVNSMSDPMYWEQSWYEKIVKRIAENQQHTFIILTKHPIVYQRWTFPLNTWLGITIENQNQMERFADMYFCLTGIDRGNIFFISFEPIQSKIKLYIKPDWIIVGPETGNRKGKHICTPEMLEPFFDLRIPVFMKGACSKIIDRPLRQEWPE